MRRSHLTLALVLPLAMLLAACGDDDTDGDHGGLSASSNEFDDGDAIPAVFTCDGNDISPPLDWEGVPDGTATLAITLTDPDAPGETFVHWLVANIPGDTTEIPRDWDPASFSQIAVGRNDFGDEAYGGPCPPPSHDADTYEFTVYALDAAIDFEPGDRLPDLEAAIEGHVLARATLEATYDR